MPWYHGPTLMAHLETVPVGDDLAEKPFRLPVQWVNRPNQNFRGFSGTIVSGTREAGRRHQGAALGPHLHGRARGHL